MIFQIGSYYFIGEHCDCYQVLEINDQRKFIVLQYVGNKYKNYDKDMLCKWKATFKELERYAPITIAYSYWSIDNQLVKV